MDAVISDFVAGAAEILSPDAAADHWDVIEGQGSLFHPAYAGVSLGLLHGSQPDVFVLCHEPGREHLLGYPDFPTPSLPEAIARHIAMGSLTNAKIRCAGVSFNTASLRPATADTLMQAVAQSLGLPVADPMRGGAALERLIESCLAS
jgi:D-glutamate N-acetyltransferase